MNYYDVLIIPISSFNRIQNNNSKNGVQKYGHLTQQSNLSFSFKQHFCMVNLTIQPLKPIAKRKKSLETLY